jgi:hypothetical protein
MAFRKAFVCRWVEVMRAEFGELARESDSVKCFGLRNGSRVTCWGECQGEESKEAIKTCCSLGQDCDDFVSD